MISVNMPPPGSVTVYLQHRQPAEIGMMMRIATDAAKRGDHVHRRDEDGDFCYTGECR